MNMDTSKESTLTVCKYPPAFPPEIVSRLPVRIDNPLLTHQLCFLVTTQCNIKCDYCYNYYTKQHIHMSPELGVGFIKTYLTACGSVENSTPYQIIFTGGEPTINHETIFAIMDVINELQLDCVPTLLTNGILSASLLQRFIDYKFLFQLSYDGGKNEHRVTNAQNPVHDKMVNVFRVIKEAGAPIVLRATISKNNVYAMIEIVKFAKNNGVSLIIFDTLDPVCFRRDVAFSCE